MDPQNLIDATAKMAEIFPNAYDDGLSPAVKSSGKAINLIPRAINAALVPLEKWILNREYSIEETKLLLEEKLKNRNSNNIVSPEPYVAVPALQAISYCASSHALRNMYANLLANSMDSTVKDDVHPTFVELIKQLSPFDANLLNEISSNADSAIPISKVRLEVSSLDGSGIDILKHILSPKFGISINNYTKFAISIDNLQRLNLISVSYDSSYTDKSLYDPIKNSNLIENFKNRYSNNLKFKHFKIQEGCVNITDLGKSFIDICVG